MQDFWSSSSEVSESQERSLLIEQYLEAKEKQQLHYPRMQEQYFCAYEEFDAKKEGNQIISYGRQLCESFFIQDQEINCPEEEGIPNACFAHHDCSQCEVKRIPKQLVRGSGGSYPMKFVLQNGKVQASRMPEDGEEDENGEGGYYGSIKATFSKRAFRKFKSYQLNPELKEKVLQKAQHYFLGEKALKADVLSLIDEEF